MQASLVQTSITLSPGDFFPAEDGGVKRSGHCSPVVRRQPARMALVHQEDNDSQRGEVIIAIGVMDDPQWPHDEHDADIGEPHRCLIRGEPVEYIARYLCFIEVAWMGLKRPSVSARLSVADRLMATDVSGHGQSCAEDRTDLGGSSGSCAICRTGLSLPRGPEAKCFSQGRSRVRPLSTSRYKAREQHESGA